MSCRLFLVMMGLAVIGLISGCATQPHTGGYDTEDQEEPINGPSTVIVGAKVDEVRAIAMGAARAKGWTIVKASNQRVVQRRPVNPDAPQAVAAGLVSDGAQPTIEVTSVYHQVQNGVQVTVNAQLVSKAPGNDSVEQRTDYTESYRDDLSRALDSLQSAWAENRQRVARALPPIDKAGQSAAETAAELNSGPVAAIDDPADALVQSPTEPEPEPEPTAWGQETEPQAAAAPPDAYDPMITAPVAGTQSGATVPVSRPSTTGSFPAPVRNLSPAPVVGAAPVSSADNMMALNSGSSARSQISNAERYAQFRGCQVQPGRTSVFRREGDAEYLRVYCAGDPAFVIKCSNGICKGLE